MVSRARHSVFTIPMGIPGAKSSWQVLFLNPDFLLGKEDRDSHPKLLLLGYLSPAPSLSLLGAEQVPCSPCPFETLGSSALFVPWIFLLHMNFSQRQRLHRRSHFQRHRHPEVMEMIYPDAALSSFSIRTCPTMAVARLGL